MILIRYFVFGFKKELIFSGAVAESARRYDIALEIVGSISA